eukprot:SAG31_NODE_7469_length_1681_cov_2.082174_2_plen_67_part_00
MSSDYDLQSEVVASLTKGTTIDAIEIRSDSFSLRNAGNHAIVKLMVHGCAGAVDGLRSSFALVMHL